MKFTRLLPILTLFLVVSCIFFFTGGCTAPPPATEAVTEEVTEEVVEPELSPVLPVPVYFLSGDDGVASLWRIEVDGVTLTSIKDSCIRGGHALFYASNFSPGMNIMFELNKKLAKLLGRYPGYNILIEEIHHAGKIDAPSGTAITLAKDIIHYHPVKKIWVNKPAKSPDQLEIISLRRNQVPGMHFVKYDSPADSLEIRHTAHSRQGFALGALMAAKWLAGKKGVFTMSDLLYDNE